MLNVTFAASTERHDQRKADSKALPSSVAAVIGNGTERHPGDHDVPGVGTQIYLRAKFRGHSERTQGYIIAWRAVKCERC